MDILLLLLKRKKIYTEDGLTETEQLKKKKKER